MILCEIIMITLTMVACLVSSYTDIKNGKIYNSFLIGILTSGLILDGIYYCSFAREYIVDFSVNMAIVICISILLYAFHVWAAGDSKMLIVALLSVPARWYAPFFNNKYTLIFIIVFSFVAGYIYIIVDSVLCAIKRKAVTTPTSFGGYFKRFLTNYFASINYLLLINLLDVIFLSKYVNLDFISYFAMGLLVLLIVSKIDFLRSLYLVIPIFAINLTVGLALKIGLYQINYKSYIFVLVFELIRFFSSRYNYVEIETKSVRPGMILSAASSVLINMSKSKRIPGISKEDQRNRLTESESEAVIAWGRSRYGAKTITIVRKIPFAIFISFGIIIYLILGGCIL